MTKCFSKKYGNMGWPLYYLQSESYVKMPVSAWYYIPTEAIATSLIQLDIIIPDICAFIVGFNCTV